MGRFAPKYTLEQKQEIVRLRTEDGLGAREIVARAAAGEITGLEPCQLPLSSVYYIWAQDRPKDPPSGDYYRSRLNENTVPRLFAIVDGELTKVERQYRNTGTLDHVRFGRVLRLAERLAGTVAKLPNTPARPVQKDLPAQPAEPEDFLSRLAHEKEHPSTGDMEHTSANGDTPTRNTPVATNDGKDGLDRVSALARFEQFMREREDDAS